jgi:hypothetical protein
MEKQWNGLNMLTHVDMCRKYLVVSLICGFLARRQSKRAEPKMMDH